AVPDSARNPLLHGRNVARVAPARHARPAGPRAPAVLARRFLAGLVAEVRRRPRQHPAAAVDSDLEALPIVLVETRVGRLVDEVERRPDRSGPTPRRGGVGVVEPVLDEGL